jgi:hypothetical protein
MARHDLENGGVGLAREGLGVGLGDHDGTDGEMGWE